MAATKGVTTNSDRFYSAVATFLDLAKINPDLAQQTVDALMRMRTGGPGPTETMKVADFVVYGRRMRLATPELVSALRQLRTDTEAIAQIRASAEGHLSSLKLSRPDLFEESF
ncbi:MAG: hypothetical protein COV46_03525 [Deltaproteobacteria bacterium CG11_big_fil_rev_8_21_14_0_20_49_13]|nr:MAG: hypothetical protein COV46_03525 [Deltaproteobacteria bacterium CG11_big_fil_rev_8_21_14_0_20_49_13]